MMRGYDALLRTNGIQRQVDQPSSLICTLARAQSKQAEESTRHTINWSNQPGDFPA